MSPLKMGSKQVKALSAEELAGRALALQQALESVVPSWIPRG